MVDIVLDCQRQIKETIQEYLATFYKGNYISYDEIETPFLLIKEITSKKDAEELKKVKAQGISFGLLCIVEDESLLFEILDIHACHFLRLSHLQEDMHAIYDYITMFTLKKESLLEIVSSYEKLLINIYSIS